MLLSDKEWGQKIRDAAGGRTRFQAWGEAGRWLWRGLVVTRCAHCGPGDAELLVELDSMIVMHGNSFGSVGQTSKLYDSQVTKQSRRFG